MDFSHQRIAIVHDTFYQYGGAERVVDALCEVFPSADVFVSRFSNNPSVKHLVSKVTKTTFLQHLPWVPLINKLYVPLLPLAFESLDLRSYDIVISSTAHFAKGVLTNSDQLHVCYCHTPPRFLYGYSSETSFRSTKIGTFFLSGIDHKLREYDFVASQRPDIIITNSQTTQKRINKFYKRDAHVIYPPINTMRLNPTSTVIKHDYFLVVSRLVSYKNVKTVISAFNQNKQKLIVVGEGNQAAELKNLAESNITFTSFVSDTELVNLYQKARAVIFATADEDFGIVPVESMAAGTPVIALKSGGVTETVDEQTGIFYDKNTVEHLNTAVSSFIANEHTFNSEALVTSAQKYSKEAFIENIKQTVYKKLQTITSEILE